MYGGEIELVFDTLAHKYSVNGETVPGATTCLGVLSKPALTFWAANMAADYWKDHIKPGVSLDEIEIDNIWKASKRAHSQKKDESASLGTMVHKFVEDYIKGLNPELSVNPEMRGAEEKFLKWVEDHKVKFVLAEQPIYSKKFGYAGTLDFICIIDGHLWLGDLKTSNGIYDEYVSQTSAYWKARIEEFPTENYMGVVIVRVGKDEAEIEVKTMLNGELGPYFDLFTSCLDTYKKLNIIKSLTEKK